MKKLLGLLTALVLSSSVVAQDATKFVISSAPGGMTHKYAMVLERVLTRGLGKVVPEIRAGAEGTIAARYVNQFRNSQEVVLMIGSQKDWTPMNFDLTQTEDFITIAYLGYVPGVIVSSASSQCSTLRCVIEASRTQRISYGIAINNPARQLISLLVNQYANSSNVVEVPFKSGGEAATAAMGGHVDFSVTVPEVAESLVKGQKVKVIATVGNVNGYEALTLPNQGMAVSNETKYYTHLFVWSNLTPNTLQVTRVRQVINDFLSSREFAEVRADFYVQLPKQDTTPLEVLKNLIAR